MSASLDNSALSSHNKEEEQENHASPDTTSTTGSSVFDTTNNALRQKKKRSATQDSTSSQMSSISTESELSTASTTLSVGGRGSGRKRKQKKGPYLNVAPINTPLKHRLETLAVVWLCISIPAFITIFLICISLGWIVWLTVILPYFIWWYGFDLHTPTNGKVAYRVRNSMKNFINWEWFVNYFPIRAHKTVDLEPTFTKVLVEQNGASTENDDELDLVSEDSTTVLDNVF